MFVLEIWYSDKTNSAFKISSADLLLYRARNHSVSLTPYLKNDSTKYAPLE